MIKLPKKLNKEPLIDVIFEIRFSSKIPAADILPGSLYSSLKDVIKVERLPASIIPKEMRTQESATQYAALIRLEQSNYVIGIGDNSISIGCKFPYPGWTCYKSEIMTVMNAVQKTGIVDTVGRYSLKYVDLIEIKGIQDQYDALQLKLNIADIDTVSSPMQLRIEINLGKFVNILQLFTGANVILMNSTTKSGLIVDNDTICDAKDISIEELLLEFEERLEEIHAANKEMFFKCLTEQAIKSLEPDYE